jgi:hypothetical protein
VLPANPLYNADAGNCVLTILRPRNTPDASLVIMAIEQ